MGRIYKLTGGALQYLTRFTKLQQQLRLELVSNPLGRKIRIMFTSIGEVNRVRAITGAGQVAGQILRHNIPMDARLLGNIIEMR
jgi:hypothetical protein